MPGLQAAQRGHRKPRPPGSLLAAPGTSDRGRVNTNITNPRALTMQRREGEARGRDTKRPSFWPARGRRGQMEQVSADFLSPSPFLVSLQFSILRASSGAAQALPAAKHLRLRGTAVAHPPGGWQGGGGPTRPGSRITGRGLGLRGPGLPPPLASLCTRSENASLTVATQGRHGLFWSRCDIMLCTLLS